MQPPPTKAHARTLARTNIVSKGGDDNYDVDNSIYINSITITTLMLMLMPNDMAVVAVLPFMTTTTTTMIIIMIIMTMTPCNKLIKLNKTTQRSSNLTVKHTDMPPNGLHAPSCFHIIC